MVTIRARDATYGDHGDRGADPGREERARGAAAVVAVIGCDHGDTGFFARPVGIAGEAEGAVLAGGNVDLVADGAAVAAAGDFEGMGRERHVLGLLRLRVKGSGMRGEWRFGCCEMQASMKTARCRSMSQSITCPRRPRNVSGHNVVQP